MTKKTVHRSMVFRNKEGPQSESPGASIEDFRITYGRSPDHVTLEATRSRDMLSLCFELPGFKYLVRLNELEKPEGSTDATLVLPPQHVAETIWQQSMGEKKAVRLAAPKTRLVFTLPKGEAKIPMRIADILEMIAKGTPKVSSRALSKLEDDLEAQLELIGTKAVLASCTAKDLEDLLRDIIAPPRADETALHLIAKMSLSTSERARWQFNGTPPWSTESSRLHAEAKLHTIRLTNGAQAGLRALHSSRFDNTDNFKEHTGLVSEESKKEAEDQNNRDQKALEELMALSPSHHRDLVAQTAIPGLPALLALNADGTPKKNKTGLPSSRVVSPSFKIGYVDESKDVGIALTQPYERAQIALTGQGATIDLRYSGEPPLLMLGPVGGKDYRGFGVEASDYLTSLGMDWKVETAEKGYLFPLGIRCSLVTLVSRRVVDMSVEGESKRISRAEKITVLKMSGEPKLVNGPYCPFKGRWFPANSIRMRTLVTPPLEESANYLGQAVGKFAMFWPQVMGENGQPTDFEFEWETDDGLARSNLLFVRNEYVVDAGLMRELAKKYNDEVKAIDPQANHTNEERQALARRTAHFAGTRHRYAASEQRSGATGVAGQEDRDRGQTSFETQSWILSASGRIDMTKYDSTAALSLPTLDQQDFTMDGRMEGASQPPFYPYLRCANIRVQSADLMMGSGSGAIAVEYHPRYVIRGFGEAQTKELKDKAEIFLRTIGGNAELNAAESANRSGGVASFAAPIAALSRKIGIIGGERIANAAPGEPQYNFSAAEEGYFDGNEFLSKSKTENVALAQGSASGSLVLGSLDLNKLRKKPIDSPDVPRLLQQVEFAPKIEEQFQRGAKALDEKLYSSTGLAEDIAEGIQKLDFGDLGPADLLGRYWSTLKDMGFVKDPGRNLNPPFRNRIAAIIDTGTGSTAQDIVAFAEAVQHFGDETAAFVQNPVPEKVLDAIRKVERLVEQVANGQLAETIWKERLRDLLKAMLATAFDEFLQNNPDLAELMFGRTVTAQDLENDPAGILEGAGKCLFGGSFTTLRQNLSLLFGLVGRLKLPDISLRGEAEIDAIVRDAFRTIANQINNSALSAAGSTKDLRDPKVQREFSEAVREGLQTLVAGALTKVRIENVDDLLRTLENQSKRIKHESSPRLKAIIESFLKKANQLSEDQKQQAAEKLNEWLEDNLLNPFVFVRLDEAVALIGDVVNDPLTVHGRLLATTTNALLSLYDQSAIRTHVQKVQGLEEELRAGIVALVDTITGEGSKQYTALTNIRDQLKTWSVPVDLPWPDDGLRDDLLDLIGDSAPSRGLIGQQMRLEQLRMKIRASAGSPISEQLMADVAEALRLRAEGVKAIAQMAKRISAFQAGKPIAIALTGDLPAGIVPDLVSLAKLYLPQADLHKYDSIAQAVDGIKKQLAAVGPAGAETSARITSSFNELKKRAFALKDLLDQDPDARTLASLLADEAPKLLAYVDTSLVGDLAQFYTFPAELFAKFDAASRQAIAELWGAGTPVLEKAIDALAGVAAAAMAFVHEIKNGDLAKYVSYVLGPDGLRNIEDALLTLTAACRDADNLLGNVKVTPGGVRDALDGMVQAIAYAVQKLGVVLEKIEIRNGKQILDNAVVALLAEARRAVEELARELVPSRLTATYEWTTNLCDVAAGYPAISFCPGGLDMRAEAFVTSSALDCSGDKVSCKTEDIHLATKARFEMDVFKNELKSEISGRVAPMKIVFPSPSFHMATILLKETTFKSVNGRAPKFNVRIHDVMMGDALKFLHPLQAWMAPGKSGMYLEPRAEEIKIGFRYDAGIINLGAVRFLNLVFDVSARLPFTGSKATFGFRISDPDWPFLVVSEPYGGGGYLDLSVYANGDLRSMDFYVFFGAVSQVQFGPIKASGRIVCGIYAREEAGKGGKELGAFFEVTGRASVASFSLSLQFLVRLARDGDDLSGKAELTLTIKRGFVKFNFKARADQRIQGKRSGSTALARNAALANSQGTSNNADDPKVVVRLPNKMNNWRAYKDLFA